MRTTNVVFEFIHKFPRKDKENDYDYLTRFYLYLEQQLFIGAVNKK